MDIVDRDLEKAERDASPTRFPDGSFHPAGAEFTNQQNHSARSHGAAGSRRASSRLSSSTSSSSSDHIVREEMNMSRINTQNELQATPTRLSRIETQRSQHSGTVGRSATSRTSKKPLPPFGAGKEYPPPLPERDEYVVEFDSDDDPMHPQNWSTGKKIFISAILAYTTFVAVFTSAIFSTATEAIAEIFHVSTEVGLLGLSLYVLGFAMGPIVWAPLSELQGRKMPLCISSFGFILFSIATATGKDLQTVLICRFFGGAFASCPLAVVAAVFSDIFSNESRGASLIWFSLTVFVGPITAPLIGGFTIMNPTLGWRWTEYFPAIMGASALILNLIFLEETYAPVVLVDKARELRRRTKNWGIHAKQEEIEVDFRELVVKNFSRPLRLLFTEPIVFLVSLYMSFIYGLLYLFFTAYPIVFQQIHGFNPGVGGLPYFGLMVGMFIAGIYILLTQKSYIRKLHANNGVPIPEWRLPPVIIGGAAFAAGLFWFGWSGYRANIHWIVPTLSGLLTGFGILAIFIQSLNYIVDAYLMFAASAIAGNTFLRSIFGAVFPLFSMYMFRGIGVNWSGTLLGCVAAVLVPIPVIFYKFGARIRQRSKFAPTKPKM